MSQALSYTRYSDQAPSKGAFAYQGATARSRSSRTDSGATNWLRLLVMTALATAIFVVWLFLLREAFLSIATSMFHTPQIHYGMT